MKRSPKDAQARFAELYDRTRDDVLAYLVRRANTVEDAVDALSETYAAAWRKIETLPEGERARLWLFGAARIELRKAASRNRANDELLSSLANELRAVLSEQVRPPEPDQTLRHAIAALPPRDQEILTLTAWEELAPREIATVMGISANLVRVRLHRARRELQALLQDQRHLRPRRAAATRSADT